MNIGFYDNQLCERGTTISLYDYAYYNELILKNKSFIFYLKNNRDNKKEIIEKFNNQFITNGLNNFETIDIFIKKYKITHLYIIKSGEYDNKLSKYAKNCIHCVFNCSQPHGDVYSSISSCLYRYNKNIPIVPHMINLPKNNYKDLRKELNIPEDAIVFGGYGGKNNFNIDYVIKTILLVAKLKKNIYFLFANFNKFNNSEKNIIHIQTIYDLEYKVKFINTCDAMLWARKDGETFGISIGEFSSMNKPIIATNIYPNNHYLILKDKGFWYNNQNDLFKILINFNKEEIKKKDWNCYKDYTPDKVMKIFKKIYLE